MSGMVRSGRVMFVELGLCRVLCVAVVCGRVRFG